MLADLDRPIETTRYEPWDREISLRAMSASQFVEIMHKLAAVDDEDTAAKITVFSVICSYGVIDPVYTADEWASGARMETLIDLGNRVLGKSNNSLTDAAKKN